MAERFGVYVHVPFCKSKCYYCDFASYAGKEKWVSSYFDAVLEEIKADKNTHGKNVSTIYFGGGTPSLVDSQYIKEVAETIYAYYNVEKNAEVTLEVNPGAVDVIKLNEYKKIGINRISIGLQSTNNDELRRIGRTHTYEDFLETFDELRSTGFENISVDLMFSLPGQSKESLIAGIDKIINLDKKKGGVEHISLYSLILEEGTVMYDYYNSNNIIQDEDKDREMYHAACKKLSDSGYKKYEVSNFAKEGYESRHNMDCWEYLEYRGFGSAASSFIGASRFKNTEDIKEYINSIKKNKSPLSEIHSLNKQQEIEDYIMLGFRKVKGFNIEEFDEQFEVSFKELYKEELALLSAEGFIKFDENVRLTDKGFDLMNSVITYFFK